jgi:hypothetical protein
MFGLGFGELAIFVGLIVLPLTLGGVVVARVMRAVERRGAPRADLEQMRERLLRLEEAVSGFGDQLEQITEGQRFTTQVLAGRKDAAVANRKTDDP